VRVEILLLIALLSIGSPCAAFCVTASAAPQPHCGHHHKDPGPACAQQHQAFANPPDRGFAAPCFAVAHAVVTQRVLAADVPAAAPAVSHSPPIDASTIVLRV
jgi:hypothetical protein